MTPLHALTTTLIRLLGLFFVMKSLDNAAAPFFMIAAQAAYIPAESGLQVPNPWVMFLPLVGFYLVLAAIIFFTAPKIARLIIPVNSVKDNAINEVHWHDTLLLCTGTLIISWAFIRATDTIYELVTFSIANDGKYSITNATVIYIFMTIILFGVGFLLIAKFHRISGWMVDRRKIAKSQ